MSGRVLGDLVTGDQRRTLLAILLPILGASIAGFRPLTSRTGLARDVMAGNRCPVTETVGDAAWYNLGSPIWTLSDCLGGMVIPH